jgi:hypothetical protein
MCRADIGKGRENHGLKISQVKFNVKSFYTPKSDTL